MSFENINIDYRILFISIENCKNMIVFIKIISNNKKIQKIVRVYHIVIISFKFNLLILIRLCDNISLFINCDFIFSLYE